MCPNGMTYRCAVSGSTRASGPPAAVPLWETARGADRACGMESLRMIMLAYLGDVPR